MTSEALPPREELTIHFAHVAYRLAERFARRETGIRHFQTWNAQDTFRRCAEADVLVLSGLWDNAMLERATRLRFVQVCAAGYERFDLARLAAMGVRAASGRGVNANAVGRARDGAHARAGAAHTHRARPPAGASLARHDIAPRSTRGRARRQAPARLRPRRDRVAPGDPGPGLRDAGLRRAARHPRAPGRRRRAPLPRRPCCASFPRSTSSSSPARSPTRRVAWSEPAPLEAMRRGAFLVNVARGGCVDEPALVAAIRAGEIAGAGIDVTADEPLSPDSPLWDIENVVLTPHTAGETRRYEDNVIDILLENLETPFGGERRS